MPAKFKFHFKTARFLSPVAIVALSCSCVADAPPKSGELFDTAQTGAIERTQAEGATVSIIGEIGAKALQAQFPAGNGYPGFSFAAPKEGWNLSAFTGVQVDLSNTSQEKLTIGLRVDNAGDWKAQPWNAESLQLAPNETKTLSVTFGKSYGGNVGYALDPTKVVAVKIFAVNPKTASTITIKNLKSFGVGPERPITPTTAALVATDAAPLPVAMAATDTNLRYVGRFDWRDAAGPRCAWSASTVSLKFRGTDLNVKIKDTDSNRWQVEVDGKPTEALQMRVGEHLYRVVAGLPEGEHSVRLIRATEAFCGVSQFTGFQLNEGGKLLSLAAPKRRLEVIGDSISAGYGNEAPNQNEKFSPKTENAYFTSGAMTARSVGADYTCIAWSGRKMWPNNTVPEIYDLTLPQDTSSAWDFSKQATPDVILINLATNDFNAKEKPEQEGWVKAYRDFIGRLRKNAPDATIYCALSPMLSDDWPPTVKIRSQARGYIQRVVKESNDAGDKKVRYLEFETQNPANGLGADWHPSIKTNQIMADTILTALKTDLGWQAAP